MVHLSINCNQIIRLCGLILGGNRNFKESRGNIKYSLDKHQYHEIPFLLNSIEGYAFIHNAPDSNFYDIQVRYSPSSEVFTGRFTSKNVFEQDGATFTFTDDSNNGDEFRGPILGILYSIDHYIS